MSDTSPEITALYRSMFDALTPGERMHMTSEMFDFARKLARAGILLERPHATEVEIQQQIFLRFYKRDYTEPQRNYILALIERRFSNAAEPTRSPGD